MGGQHLEGQTVVLEFGSHFSSERAHAVWRSERSVGSRRSIVAEYRKFASGLHQKVSVLQKHRSQIDEFAG